ncbi:MAG TPA: DUF1501 domain-containing protein [Gemmataceae bacterium]|nr:DUF1501 domain-containing protein [Gemmataceae bacterium]
MLSLPGKPVRLCEGITRREWLRVGGLSSAVGLSLPQLLRARATGKVRGRAKSCIVVFLFGAPAHQDIWDLKPGARAEYRGEFKPIASSVPGTFLGEHIPRTARLLHRFALVRSVSHPDNTHTVAMHYMLTGVRHLQPQSNPQNQPSDFPCFGAVMRHLRRGDSGLPAGISLNSPANQVSANNHIFPGFFAGFLGRANDPLFVGDDPSEPTFVPFPAVDGEQAVRMRQRRSLLETVDDRRRTIHRVAATADYDQYHQKAFDLITSPEARRAFDLAGETDRSRDRYGRNHFGQALLLARRLVEAGVSLVTVNWARNDAFWDTHANNFNLLKKSLLPPFDLGFSALLDDLQQRGLLDDTLIYCLGEFGRTPAINAAAGRDHWAACNSVVLAGGGVRGGLVHGASDKNAAFPATPPVSPSDLSATVYQALGVDPHTELRDALGRPQALSSGRPLHELFS